MKPSNNKIDMRLTPTGWLGSNTIRINKITSLRVNSKKLKYEEWHQSEYQSAAHLMTLWNHRLTYLEMIIWSREHFFTSLHHIDAFPSFVLVFQRGVCVWERHEVRSVETKRKHLEWTQRSRLITDCYDCSHTQVLHEWRQHRGGFLCCVTARGSWGEELFQWGQPLAVRGWECGVSRVEHRLQEAEQAYEAQMDVGATSVPPPGRVLSAEKLPHTLDGRRQREKRAFSEFKKTCLLLFVL